MEVSLTTQVPLPQQQPQQPAPNAANAPGATQTVQGVPDQVVTATTQADETNARSEDALRRQDRSEREGALASLQELQIEGLQTRIGFDQEKDLVFLEILLPKTEDVIARIPSENLVDFLSEKFSDVIERAAAGGNREAIDQSI